MKRTEEQRLEHIIIRRMQTDTSVDAPSESLRYARNLFRTRVTAPSPSLLRRVVAVMSIDLAPNRAAFGERSATQGQARQMLFKAGDYSVDLRIEKAGNFFTVKGQVLGEGFSVVEIKIVNPENVYELQTNELSEFKFENIAMGKYILALVGKDRELVIENLEIN